MSKPTDADHTRARQAKRAGDMADLASQHRREAAAHRQAALLCEADAEAYDAAATAIRALPTPEAR